VRVSTRTHETVPGGGGRGGKGGGGGTRRLVKRVVLTTTTLTTCPRTRLSFTKTTHGPVLGRSACTFHDPSPPETQSHCDRVIYRPHSPLAERQRDGRSPVSSSEADQPATRIRTSEAEEPLRCAAHELLSRLLVEPSDLPLTRHEARLRVVERVAIALLPAQQHKWKVRTPHEPPSAVALEELPHARLQVLVRRRLGGGAEER
jgi:hypothetical protein